MEEAHGKQPLRHQVNIGQKKEQADLTLVEMA